MSFTVEKLLDIFSNAIIIAGKEYIHNKIKSFGTLDAPDSTNWVRPNEFILSSGYIFKKENIQLQKKIIGELSKKKAAGIGFKMDRHIDKFDIEVLEYANQKDIPVLRLPNNTTTYELSNLLFYYGNQDDDLNHSRKELLVKKNEFLFNILINNIGNKATIYFKANQLGIKFDKDYIVAAARYIYKNNNDNEIINNDINDKFYELFPKIKYNFDIEAGIGDFSNLFFLIPSKIEEEALKILYDIKNILNENFPQLQFDFGIGKPYSSFHLFHKSYYEALRALKIGDKIFTNSEFNTYTKLGVFRILDYAKKEELKKFIRDYLGPIIDYDTKNNTDLITTLDNFIKNNCNYRKCAKDMYLHHNSIRYRIDKIKKICNINLNSSEDLLNISIAIKLLKLVDLDFDN